MYEILGKFYEQKAICPHCGEFFGFNPEDHNEGELEYECQHCGNMVIVYAEATIVYNVVEE